MSSAFRPTLPGPFRAIFVCVWHTCDLPSADQEIPSLAGRGIMALGQPMANALIIVGLLAALAGVLLLFRFGLPFGLRTGGGEPIAMRGTPESKRREATDIGWSNVALALIAVGTGLQIWGTAIS